MCFPFLPDFLKPRLLVPCSFGVASLSADAADEGVASDDASDDASESCTGAAREDRAREGCTREGRAAAAREGRARARGARRATSAHVRAAWPAHSFFECARTFCSCATRMGSRIPGTWVPRQRPFLTAALNASVARASGPPVLIPAPPLRHAL